MIVFGASGHGKVVAATLVAAGKEVKAFFDDNFNEPTFIGITSKGVYDETYCSEEQLIIGIGANCIRELVSLKLKHAFGKVISPFAVVHDSVQLGEGSVVFMQAALQVDVVVGKHCIINTGASVDHDCNLGDFVHISPNATLCGSVNVGRLTQIGANATVLPNLVIGSNCIVGAGAVVTKDVPDNSTVVGNPARIIEKR